MISMLFGPPGCGKGTQASFLAGHFRVPHVATGDIFRKNLKEGTPLGVAAKGFMEKGQLVPDELTCEMVADRIAAADCAGGVLFDGFPRSLAQAHWLIGVSAGRAAQVVSIEVPTEVLIARIAGRRVCSKCSATYHEVFDPPPALCRGCGTASIVQRPDDQEAVVRARLDTYTRDTAPVLGVLRSAFPVYVVDGVGSVEQVGQRILQALGA